MLFTQGHLTLNPKSQFQDPETLNPKLKGVVVDLNRLKLRVGLGFDAFRFRFRSRV